MPDQEDDQKPQTPDTPEVAEEEAPESDAQPGGATVPDSQPAPTMGLDQAIFALRQLLERAEVRRQQAEQADTQEQDEALAQQGAQPIIPIQGMVYVSLDGDSIGNKVAAAEERNDETTLMEISNRINQGQDLLRQWAEQFGGKLIEAGGDEGLVKVPSTAMSAVEDLRTQYYNLVGATATVGVGETISQSTHARELGKLRGKNQVVQYFDGLEAELDARLRDEGPQDERTKIQAAGLGSAVDHDSDVPMWGVPPEAHDSVDQDVPLVDEHKTPIDPAEPNEAKVKVENTSGGKN
jgi:hypothetical protein